MTWDPNDPDRLHAEGWRAKLPSGWGVWLFLGTCALAAGALIHFVR